jgi:glycogen debranching enzyme
MSDTAYLTAVAALSGSAIGGMTSLASAWLTQRHQDRAKRVLQEKSKRQSLYKQFINEASKLYADALSHDKSDISALVSIYALIGQMRLLSSAAVVDKAEAVVRTIVETYFSPNKTFLEFRDLVETHTIDLLCPFTDECRAELEAIRDV